MAEIGKPINRVDGRLKGQHASSLNGGNPRTRLAPEEAPAAALSKLKVTGEIKENQNGGNG